MYVCMCHVYIRAHKRPCWTWTVTELTADIWHHVDIVKFSDVISKQVLNILFVVFMNEYQKAINQIVILIHVVNVLLYINFKEQLEKLSLASVYDTHTPGYVCMLGGRVARPLSCTRHFFTVKETLEIRLRRSLLAARLAYFTLGPVQFRADSS